MLAHAVNHIDRPCMKSGPSLPAWSTGVLSGPARQSEPKRQWQEPLTCGCSQGSHGSGRHRGRLWTPGWAQCGSTPGTGGTWWSAALQHAECPPHTGSRSLPQSRSSPHSADTTRVRHMPLPLVRLGASLATVCRLHEGAGKWATADASSSRRAQGHWLGMQSMHSRPGYCLLVYPQSLQTSICTRCLRTIPLWLACRTTSSAARTSPTACWRRLSSGRPRSRRRNRSSNRQALFR